MIPEQQEKMNLQRNIVPLLLIGAFLGICMGLECYVCTNQDDNTEKCLKSIKTCEQEEDWCLTEIHWGSTPYWSQGAEKQYYISKSCATKADCNSTREKYMPYCTHIWYEDWKCSECCQGDKCNYYVILGASMARSSIVVVILSSVAVFLLWRSF